MSSSLLNKWLYQDVKPVWAHQFLDALSGGDTRAKKLAVVGFLARIQVEESSGLVLLQDRIPGERRAVFEEIHKLFGGEEGFHKKIAGESWTMAVLEKKEELLRELDIARGKRLRILWAGVSVSLGVVGGLLLVLWLGDQPPKPPTLEELKPLMTPDRHAAKTQAPSPSPSVSQTPAPTVKTAPVESPSAQPTDAPAAALAKSSPVEPPPAQPPPPVAPPAPETPPASVHSTDAPAAALAESSPVAPPPAEPAVADPAPPSEPPPATPAPTTSVASALSEGSQPSEQKVAEGSTPVESAPGRTKKDAATPEPSSPSGGDESKESKLATDDELAQSMLAIVDKEMEALAATETEVETSAKGEHAAAHVPGKPVANSATRDVPLKTPNPVLASDRVETPLRVLDLEPLRLLTSRGDAGVGLQVGAVDMGGLGDKSFNPRKVAIVRYWQSPYTVVEDDQNGEAGTALSVTAPDKKHVRFSVAKMLGRTVIREGERFELTKDVLAEMGLFIQIVPREAFLLSFDAEGVVTLPRSFWDRIVEAEGKWVTVSRILQKTEKGTYHIRDVASKKIQDIQSELDAQQGR
ncbi:MAG: hypothetical protein HQL79_05095 [Magnetococcales bacterium]|nr:hypothetical protein [Magnetococcales bacterium]